MVAIRTYYHARALVQAAIQFGLIFATLTLQTRSLGFVVIWPVNALTVAALLNTRPRHWKWLAAYSGVALVAANCAAGTPLVVAIGFACANLVEIGLASYLLLRMRIQPSSLRTLRAALWFGAIVGIIAPSASAVLGAATVAYAFGQSFFDCWFTWFIADTLGLLLLLPVAQLGWRIVTRWGRRRIAQLPDGFSRAEAAVTAAALLAGCVWVFSMSDQGAEFGLRRPALLIVILAWIAARFGSAASSLATLITATICLGYCVAGSGPFVELGEAAWQWSVVNAQAFVVLAIVLTTLVASVGHERRSALDRAERCMFAFHEAMLLGEQQTIQLEIMAAELQRFGAELEATSDAKSRFLANMSHEIRTPLTAILGFAEILHERLADPQDRELISTICRNGEHLLAVINDILDISKIEAGKLEIEIVDCNPAAVAVDVATLMRHRAEAKRLTLRTEIDPTLEQTVRTDPTRLRQILINLVGNAIKFTDTGSVVIRGAAAAHCGHKTQLTFHVVDSGVGMEASQIQRLFQPFTQGDTSVARRFGGTGLGLAISQRLAEMLGGSIRVQSQPQQGSTFTLVVIADRTDVAVEQSPRPTTNERVIDGMPQTSETPLAGQRILLVEDGIDNQRLIRFFLTAAGAVVESAENGALAVEAARRSTSDGAPFDVLLMDMQMPVMDGYTATRIIRDQGYQGPIIALTANATTEDRQKCLDVGCDDFATKPIDRKQFIHLVATVAARHHATSLPVG